MVKIMHFVGKNKAKIDNNVGAFCVKEKLKIVWH